MAVPDTTMEMSHHSSAEATSAAQTVGEMSTGHPRDAVGMGAVSGRALTRVVRRQRLLLVIATAALAVCLVGLIAVWQIKSPAQQAAEQAAPPPSVLTAEVREDVLANQLVLRGTVGAASLPVKSRLAVSPAIVTGLPLSAGGAVAEGDVLIEISGRPIFALAGAIPDYRALAPGASGADVGQLQADLARLGLLTGRFQDGVFDAATGAAVSRLYKDHGYGACDESGVALCLGEAVFLPTLPATVATLSVAVGDDAAPDTALLTVQSGQAAVSAVVPGGPQTAGLAPGLTAVVSDGASQRQCDGSVATVGAYAGASPDNGPAGYPISVTTDGCLDASWLGLNVRLSITVQTTPGPVLIVPTSAIQTDADGSTHVDVVVAGSPNRRVAVNPGLVAGGEVAVTPVGDASLTAGDLVVTA